MHLRKAAISTGFISPDRAGKEPALAFDISNPLTNHLLASLPRPVFRELSTSLKLVSLKQGVELFQPGDEVEHVYFPHDGMISLLAVMKDGRAIETATIGSEGGVGIMAGVGIHISRVRAAVQLPLVASQISAAAFRHAVQSSILLRSLVAHTTDKILAQVQITAACNALHSIEARLARWILQSNDRARGTKIPLTQELLSQMLGVTRSSISEIATKLQATHFIRYTRGNIEIVDRVALEKVACECYAEIRKISHEA